VCLPSASPLAARSSLPRRARQLIDSRRTSLEISLEIRFIRPSINAESLKQINEAPGWQSPRNRGWWVTSIQRKADHGDPHSEYGVRSTEYQSPAARAQKSLLMEVWQLRFDCFGLGLALAFDFHSGDQLGIPRTFPVDRLTLIDNVAQLIVDCNFQ